MGLGQVPELVLLANCYLINNFDYCDNFLKSGHDKNCACLVMGREKNSHFVPNFGNNFFRIDLTLSRPYFDSGTGREDGWISVRTGGVERPSRQKNSNFEYFRFGERYYWPLPVQPQN